MSDTSTVLTAEAVAKITAEAVATAMKGHETARAARDKQLDDALAEIKHAREASAAEQRAMVEDLRSDRRAQGQRTMGDRDPLWFGRFATCAINAQRAARASGGEVHDLAEKAAKARSLDHIAPLFGQAREFAQNRSRALSSDTVAAGGVLIPAQLSDEVVELVRPRSVVLSMGPQTMPMPGGSLEIPRITSGSSVTWTQSDTGEANEGGPVLGSIILRAKPAQAIAAISNALLSRAGDVAARIVQEDVLAAFGSGYDAKYLRGLGAEGTPKGLRYWAVSGNVNGITGSTLAAVRADVANLILAKLMNLAQGNQLGKLGFIFSPRTWAYLLGLTDGNGNAPFEAGLLAASPKFYSAPASVTSNIPITEGVGANESEIFAADFANIVVGSPDAFEVALSTEAAYKDANGNLVSAFSKNQTVIRVSGETDLIDKRGGDSIAVLTGVTY